MPLLAQGIRLAGPVADTTVEPDRLGQAGGGGGGVLARLRHPGVAAVLAPLIESGVVATCGVIEFELRWATRSSAEFDQARADRDAGYEWLATHDADWRRALDVQAALWRGGRIRALGLPDLLIAAIAERERVTVLHYNGDYELIAQVTGQPVQWVVPCGTVP